MMSRVVLVTGVSRHLGARIVNALQADPRVTRVVGVDMVAPKHALDTPDFVQTDLHDSTMGSVVHEFAPDTVLDLGLTVEPATATAPAHSPYRGRAGDPVRLGAMQLLSACQRSASVRRLVVHSAPVPPAVEIEDGQDSVDGQPDENTAAGIGGLIRRRPDIAVATVRPANVIGPSTESALTRYLGMPVVPTVRGYDPRMQFIHEDDIVEVMLRMTMSACTGRFDAAASGTLPLSLCLKWAGRSQRPVRERRLRLPRRLRGRGSYSAEQVRRLCSGGVLDEGDLERALGWRPRYSSVEAFEAFVSTRAHHH